MRSLNDLRRMHQLTYIIKLYERLSYIIKLQATGSIVAIDTTVRSVRRGLLEPTLRKVGLNPNGYHTYEQPATARKRATRVEVARF